MRALNNVIKCSLENAFLIVTGKYDTFFFSKVWSSLLIKYK